MQRLLLFLALSPLLARADVKLPAIFSDHAVLQREVAVPIWGWADPGEEVTVTIAGQAQSTKAGADGKWTAKLAPLREPGSHTLTIKGKNTLTINDVLLGEVWLGSGQSNMAMLVQGARDFEQEKAAASNPEIRMFTEGSGASETPQTLGKGQWIVCSPETVGRFSATLYFFGRDVQKVVGGPMGLINSSVGGTPIESWIALEAQQKTPELQKFFEMQKAAAAKIDPVAAKARYEKALAAWPEKVKEAKAAGQAPPRRPADPTATGARRGNPGGLFNGKIAPLIPYAIRGAIWYQGEANTTPEKAPYYQYQLPLLVSDWRARWGQGDFPFAWAQLPNFDRPANNWPLVREAMLKTLKLPNTGMGINIDIGEARDIHPKNKQDIGRRLSLWALGTVYGKDVPAVSGPLPARHKVNGNEIVLSFKHAEGLTAKDGELKGFTIAGEDKVFQPAQAKIQGDKVIVSHPQIAKPVAVRYAWASWPTCNLYNGAGLPASPFRTDDFPDGP